MASHRKRNGWIGALRRDGFLFALLGAFVLVFNALQPLAAANASTFSGLRVICAQNRVAADQSNGGHGSHTPGSSDCPCCIGGVCPMASGPAKAILDNLAKAELNLPACVEGLIFGGEEASFSPSPLRYPAPIRAPPLAV